jgi:hypothetical protein
LRVVLVFDDPSIVWITKGKGGGSSPLYIPQSRNIMINPLEARISAVKPDKSDQDSEDYNDT